MNRPIKYSSLFFFPLFFATVEGAAPPSDTPYLKIPLTKKADVIFSDFFKEEEPFIRERALSVFKEYERNFPVRFYRKNSLILFSPLRRQTHSAVTHAVPLPASRISPSPFQIMDKSAVNNWLTDVFIHEIAHIYQFNARPLLSHLLSYIMPSHLWPVHPNIYLHNLILEGHAVLLESTYGTGGRLFSGYNRAVAFSQLKNGLSLKRVVNDYDNPLSKREKYIHGGYFFSYLRRGFTLSRLNKIFPANGRNLLWPIGIYTVNRSFKKTLGRSFESLFKEYREFYGQKAREQKSSGGKILAVSQFALPVNSNSDNLFFMISDGKGPPELAVLNRKTEEVSLKKVNMPLGKVFFVDGNFYSAGYGRTDTLSVRFSLFRDGFVPLKKYNSRYVMDIRENKVLSFNAFDGLRRQNLYLNGSLLNNAHSTAVTDERGGVWYFKQEGANRTLYRDKTPLWTYKGYYGFPVEAEESGVYFLAPTARGSGLFVYKNNQALRLSPSDTVVAARRVSEASFLVCEINNDRFEYKIIPIRPFPELPAFYKYSFKKTDLIKEQTSPEPPIQPQKSGSAVFLTSAKSRFDKRAVERRTADITSKKRIYNSPPSAKKQILKTKANLSEGDSRTAGEEIKMEAMEGVEMIEVEAVEDVEMIEVEAVEDVEMIEVEAVEDVEMIEMEAVEVKMAEKPAMETAEGAAVEVVEMKMEEETALMKTKNVSVSQNPGGNRSGQRSTNKNPEDEREEEDWTEDGKPLAAGGQPHSENNKSFSEDDEEEDFTEDGEPLLEDKRLSKTEGSGRARSVYYNSVLNLQIHEIALGWGVRDFFNTRGRPFLYRLALTDPLNWSALSIQGAFSQSVRRFLALYEYKRYRPAGFLSWQTAGWLDRSANYLQIHHFLAGLKYPLMRMENLALTFSAVGTYKTRHKGMNVKHYLIPELSLNFSFKRRPPFAMYNYRNFRLSLIHQNEYSFFRNMFYPSYGLKWALENELFKEVYIDSKGDFRTLRKKTDTLSPVLLAGNQGSYSLHTLFWDGGGKTGDNCKKLLNHPLETEKGYSALFLSRVLSFGFKALRPFYRLFRFYLP